MYKIFIVEDDTVIAQTVRQKIASWGYSVLCAEQFDDIMPAFLAYEPQLVLLDITLPFYNGYHWCQEIRRVSKVPVVFISSAADNMNIVMAMNLGADDFIAKPFDLDVLTAKVQAILRRTYDFTGDTRTLSHKGLLLHLNDMTLSCGGTRVELSKNEFRILQLLLENKGSVVSREALMTHLWETDSFIDDNTLTVNMTRLRKKLEDAGAPDCIATKKGAGYLLD